MAGRARNGHGGTALWWRGLSGGAAARKQIAAAAVVRKCGGAEEFERVNVACDDGFRRLDLLDRDNATFTSATVGAELRDSDSTLLLAATSCTGALPRPPPASVSTTIGGVAARPGPPWSGCGQPATAMGRTCCCAAEDGGEVVMERWEREELLCSAGLSCAELPKLTVPARLALAAIVTSDADMSSGVAELIVAPVTSADEPR